MSSANVVASLDPKKNQSQIISQQRLKALHNVKLDSPRFVQACRELGVLPESLKPLSFNAFSETGVSEDICQLRYTHHINRIAQTIRDVYAKRKEIRERGMTIQPESSTRGLPPHTKTQSSKTLGAMLSGFTTPNALSPRLPPPGNKSLSIARQKREDRRSRQDTPSTYQQLFRSTISYLDNSHVSPDVVSPKGDIGDKSKLLDPGNLSSMLSDQVNRYNRAKIKLQSEAQNVFEAERWRFDLLEEMKKKADRIDKIAQDKQDRSLEIQKIAKVKADQRALRLERRLHMLEDEKLRRLEKLEAKERHHTEFAESYYELQQQRLADSETRHNDRMRAVIERRESFAKEVDEKLDTQMSTLDDRFEEHSTRLEEMLDEKVKKMRGFSEKVTQQYERYKDEIAKRDAKILLELQSKLIKRDQVLRDWMIKQVELQEKRRLDFQEREKKFVQAKAELNTMDNQKKILFEERIQKAEEHLYEKREKEAHEIELKQEYRRLKEGDKEENYQRERRREDYRTHKTKDREVRSQDRLQRMKISLELVGNVRKEVALHTRLEKQRVLSGITALTSELSKNHALNGDELPPLTANEAEKLTKSLKLLDSIVREDQMSEGMKAMRISIVTALKKYRQAVEEAQKLKQATLQAAQEIQR